MHKRISILLHEENEQLNIQNNVNLYASPASFHQYSSQLPRMPRYGMPSSYIMTLALKELMPWQEVLNFLSGTHFRHLKWYNHISLFSL